MPRLNTLRMHVVFWSMFVNGLLLISFGSGVWLVLRQVQNRQVNDTLQLSAAQIEAAVDSSNGHLIIPPDDQTTLSDRGLFSWIINDSGAVDVATGQASKFLPPLMQSDFLDTRNPQNELVRLYRYPLKEIGGTLVVGISLKIIEQTQQTVLLILSAAIPLALIISAIGSVFLANRALSPITRITEQAKRISRENLSERLAFTSSDEVGQLAKTFDHMLDRLQLAFEHERQFIGNVSHELRTPLSMLKAQISLALSRPRDAETFKNMMTAMDGDVDRMTRLVESMLTLIRTEATQIQVMPVNLSDLLVGLMSQLEPLAEAKQITLALKASANVWVSGDPDQLVQLLLNLLDNALKHTDIHGQVTVQITANGSEWQIVVSDNGVGIAPEHLNNLFDRFYRIDPSRTRQTGGAGLGLSIAQAIVQQHGGRITVQSHLGKGSTFTVFLPALSA